MFYVSELDITVIYLFGSAIHTQTQISPQEHFFYSILSPFCLCYHFVVMEMKQ